MPRQLKTICRLLECDKETRDCLCDQFCDEYLAVMEAFEKNNIPRMYGHESKIYGPLKELSVKESDIGGRR